MPAATTITLIRHAPTHATGLAGRRDIPAHLPDGDTLARLAAQAGPPVTLIASPLIRCVVTARALFPDREPVLDPALVEQDFGDWEGQVPPDLGRLSPETLASHRPPGGESFDGLCARVWPGLQRAAASPGPVVIVAHAGTIRAALARAMGAVAPALSFQIAPLSLTRILAHPAGWSIAFVNRI